MRSIDMVVKRNAFDEELIGLLRKPTCIFETKYFVANISNNFDW